MQEESEQQNQISLTLCALGMKIGGGEGEEGLWLGNISCLTFRFLDCLFFMHLVLSCV